MTSVDIDDNWGIPDPMVFTSWTDIHNDLTRFLDHSRRNRKVWRYVGGGASGLSNSILTNPINVANRLIDMVHEFDVVDGRKQVMKIQRAFLLGYGEALATNDLAAAGLLGNIADTLEKALIRASLEHERRS